ncbi:MAG: hypothetical protein ACOX6V_00290 [Patescibacteria group bacterium]
MSDNQSPKPSLLTGILVSLLVIAAFFVGRLSAQVQQLEKNETVAGEQAKVEETAPQQQPSISEGLETVAPTAAGIATFMEKKDAEICKEDGKPLVYLFSTTRCPHCVWIADTFDEVVAPFMNAGQIAAYHWEFDTKDNTVTSEIETAVPPQHENTYFEFNPEGTVPTFVVGCKYFRVGNAYEREGESGKAKEAAELKAAIEDVLK